MMRPVSPCAMCPRLSLHTQHRRSGGVFRFSSGRQRFNVHLEVRQPCRDEVQIPLLMHLVVVHPVSILCPSHWCCNFISMEIYLLFVCTSHYNCSTHCACTRLELTSVESDESCKIKSFSSQFQSHLNKWLTVSTKQLLLYLNLLN